MKGERLTKAQARALRHLESVNWCTPARLGEAMSERKHISAQGAGRVGGAMGTRLVKMGLARRQRAKWNATTDYDAGYAITEAGRLALSRERSGE